MWTAFVYREAEEAPSGLVQGGARSGTGAREQTHRGGLDCRVLTTLYVVSRISTGASDSKPRRGVTHERSRNGIAGIETGKRD